jgi:hypothetical protein
MIKKLMIFTIMALFSIFLFVPPVNAASVLVEEPSADTGGLWHVEDGNRVYVYMRFTDGSTVRETGSSSNNAFPEYDYSLFTYWPTGSENDFSLPRTSLYNNHASISNPDPTVYDKFVVEIIPHMMVTSGPEPDFKVVQSYTSVVNDITINLHDWEDRPIVYYTYDYSYITLSVDGNEILNSRNSNEDVYNAIGIESNPNYSDMSFGVRMYWETSSTEDEIDPGVTENPWLALPETTGSPVNPIGDWGTVSNISIDNQRVSFNINYLGVTYPILSFTVDGDLDFIDESNDVLYYSDPTTGDRILYFNFGETLDSAILAARTFSTVNVWKGEALWNLTQNQIKVTDVLTVYNYIPEVDEDGNVYSYFYMPDVPMDNLISVSAVLAYRYWDDGFLGIGELEPGEVQYKAVAAVRGETTSVNPTWVETTYKTSYLVGGVAAVATATVGWIPVYGWGVAGAAFLVGGALQVSDVNEWFAYDVDQIQHVIPSVALTNEINSYILETSGEDSFTADTDKLYKLHLATLQDEDNVQIMGDLSNVTQVVWETDGEIFVVNDEYIADVGWGGPGTLVPQDDIGNEDLEILIWVGVGVTGLYVFSKLKLDKKPGLMVLIIAAAIYYLYKIGLI